VTRLTWLALPVALLLLAGCSGGGASKSDISDTAANFYRALSDDPPTAYTYLSADCRAKIGYLDFVATINDFHGFLGKGDLKVKNVKIVEQTHDHITADYDVVLKSGDEEIPLTGQLDLEGPARLVKEDGHWRFEDCAGYPAPDAAETPGSQAVATPTFEPDSPAAVEADDDPSLPGEFVDLQTIYGGHWGNQDGVNTARHTQTAVDYRVQGDLPPAGGPHWGAGRCPADPSSAPLYCGPVPWGVYEKPFPAESVVHNMEHAGVVIWYNTTNQDVISRLKALAAQNVTDGKFIVMMPYPDMDSETIALTAWARRDKFAVGDYRDQRAQRFIDKLECHFDPERLCTDKPGPTPLSGNSA
jgi:hypothetical protein